MSFFHFSERIVLTDDGFRTVEAFEYNPIPCLTTELAPGIKLLVLGPIRWINRMFLLEEENVQILGGRAEKSVRRKQPVNYNPMEENKELPTVNVPNDEDSDDENFNLSLDTFIALDNQVGQMSAKAASKTSLEPDI